LLPIQELCLGRRRKWLCVGFTIARMRG
jgi:hypothetical protein